MEDLFNFKDIFKKSALNLESFNSLSYVDMFWGLLISLLVGIFIYWIYRKCYRGVVYSHNYNMTFVLMTIITSLIIMTISTNIVLSLGMVGALSIVRFRTAVKDPMDIIYMFWSVSAGIACGAKIYPIAVIGSLVVGATIWVLSKRKDNGSPYLIIIHYEERAEEDVKRQMRKIQSVLKSKTIRKTGIELTVEIKMKGDNLSIANALSATDGVQDVVVVSYNGDYAQ